LKTFSELDLISPLQRALAEENYKTPTPIQAQTIPDAMRGEDILGCAQTGTGKTAAFALPIMDHLGHGDLSPIPNRPFALVLAPTRELAVQIDGSFSTYGRYLNLKNVLIYGGVSHTHQIRALKRGAHIVVATPGRLLDLMDQGHVCLDRLETFVLDEADRMLDMGFLPDLKRIIRKLPEQRQSLFFSATLPPKIVNLTRELLNNPIKVNVTPRTTSVKKITQSVVHTQKKEKQNLLVTLLADRNVERAIVFTKTKRGANVVSQRLERKGIRSAAIHGNKSQNARQRSLNAFRNNQVRVLVATDVAARGIDIDGVTHVVNFDIPHEPEAYVHRIGRTGRAGAEGTAISFCTADEQRELSAIEKLIGHKVPAENEPAQRATDAPGNKSARPSNRSRRNNRGSIQGKTSESAFSGQSRSRRRKPRKGRYARQTA